MNISKRLLAAALVLALLAAGCQSAARGEAPSSPASQSQPAQEEPSSPAESTPESVPEESAPEEETAAGESRPDGLPVFPQEAVGENTPASFLGKTFGDVTAFYGEDYQMGQRNSQYISYQLEDGGILVFHCSSPREWGTFDAANPVTYVSVSGAAGMQVTRDISLGMTLEEVMAAMPEGLEAPPAEGPGAGGQWSWYGELNGSLCRVFLFPGEDGTLQSVDIKGEELMDQLAQAS